VTLGGHRSPDEMLADFDAGAQGTKDIDMRGILHEILADIQDSYTKAMLAHGASDVTAKTVTTSVTDYIVNHYGDN
jgi:hypothetical protein